MRLYLVMGSVNCVRDPLLVLEEALQGGITCFQFREKGDGALVGKDAVSLARHMQKLCRSYNVPFIVNDDVELAMELDADGIHTGQGDTPLHEIRLLMPNKIIGVSAHDVNEAHEAVAAGADYLGVGPMYATTTKKDTYPVRGPIAIEEMRQHDITLPLVGIGGINYRNAAAVMQAGADGVAVISSISMAPCARTAAQQLLVLVDDHLKRRDHDEA